MKTSRLAALDGLRGIAVLLVVGYHLLPRTESPNVAAGIFPIDPLIEPFKFGKLGVDLFFIISGFVIVMTLENCTSAGDFFLKRFARIWPALLVWSIISYAILLIAPAPFVRPDLSWFLPSLTLSSEKLWPGSHMISIVYWTLVVEVRFYLIALALFLVFKVRLPFALVGFSIINLAVRFVIKRYTPEFAPVYEENLIPDFMPWFAAGAMFYSLHQRRIGRVLALCLLAPMLTLCARSAAFGEMPTIDRAEIAAIAIAFFCVFWLVSTGIKIRLLEHPALVAVGVWSYSIYLLHFVAGLVAISFIPKGPLAVPLVLSVSVMTVLTGYLSYRFVERPARLWLLRLENKPLQAAC